MRPEEDTLVEVKHEEKTLPQARIEERMKLVPQYRQVVVLELTPEQAQTLYAIGNHGNSVIDYVFGLRASSDLRAVKPHAKRHLGDLFYQLQKVLLQLNPGVIS